MAGQSNSSTMSSRTKMVASAMFVAMASVESFTAPSPVLNGVGVATPSSPESGCSIAISSSKKGPQHMQLRMSGCDDNDDVDNDNGSPMEKATKAMATAVTTAAISAAFMFHAPLASFAEDELAAKYGGKGFDSSLVDQTCFVDKCSAQAKACLADDPSCRKGLTCTAKCLGDNACITGCMARYGDKNLDNFLKCTIEDNECIKVAILDGGADKFGEEPRAPHPTVRNFDMKSMEGSWYKVVGYNPNYDCYACQRNTFSAPDRNKLKVDVEFSMPHMLPDGTPAPPMSSKREVVSANDDGLFSGASPIAFNDYETHETMVFDNVQSPLTRLVMGKGTEQEASYARTAHSEGEMFGLKFWENWYIIGENDPGDPEFKFVFFNGKTRQNTYEGAFVYSRQRELPQESMAKVYKIAQEAGMNPDQFCKIRNGCFQTEDPTIVKEPESGLGAPTNPFRGILASTKVSQFFGVEPVAAENLVKRTSVSPELMPDTSKDRAWWYEVGDYLENPHRHYDTISDLRLKMDWPEDVVDSNGKGVEASPLN